MEDTDRIIRAETRSRFTTVDNEMREDKRLSWGARGLLLYLIGLPANWQVNITHLMDQSPEGRDATRSKLKELITFGYVSRKQIWDKEIGKNVWLTMVYELPSMNPHFNPLTEMPREGIDPLTENPLTPFQEETPLTENPTVQNTYLKEDIKNDGKGERTYAPPEKQNSQSPEKRPNTDSPLAMELRNVCKKTIILSPNDKTKMEQALMILEAENATVAQMQEFGRKVKLHWIGRDSKTKQPRAPGILQVAENWKDVLDIDENAAEIITGGQNANIPRMPTRVAHDDASLRRYAAKKQAEAQAL